MEMASVYERIYTKRNVLQILIDKIIKISDSYKHKINTHQTRINMMQELEREMVWIGVDHLYQVVLSNKHDSIDIQIFKAAGDKECVIWN